MDEYNYDKYDAGELDVALEVTQVVLSKKEAEHVLIYPKVECYVAFDGNAKEIFLPALTWTPISINASDFKIRAVADLGKVHWQAWYL